MHVHADRLGSIVMIELRNAISIPHGELKQLWQGLSEAHLPRARHPKDAFRKATPRNKRANGLQLEPYLDQRFLNRANLDLAVVMTRVSDAKTRVSKLHRNKLVIALDKSGAFIPIGDPQTKEEAEYLQQIQDLFYQYTDEQAIDGTMIRRAVKDAALGAHAFDIKGGVFMFPEQSVPTAEALIALSQRLNDYLPEGTRPNETMIVDYLDTPLQRDQLKTKLDIYIRDTIEQQFAEVQKRTKAPTARGKAGIFGELAELGVLIDTYEGILKEKLIDLRAYQQLQQAAIEAELKKL